jgi:hypothetical protein
VIAAVLADWGFEASSAWEPVPASDATLVEGATFRWSSLPNRFSRRSDIERREDVQIEEASTTDVAALPGRIITTDLLRREANKRHLASLIDYFLHQPLTWGPEETSRISHDTRLAASRFIELLPDEVPLPQIAPDGEGGIVMHWEQQGARHILGDVDGWRLHFVVDAGHGRSGGSAEVVLQPLLDRR